MHNDEAVNAYLAGKVLAGEGYRYDPVDRHGPALTELALPLARLQGAKSFPELTESRLRLVPVLAGSATVLLFGAAVEMLGFIPCLVAALLFAFGPLPVYYSRYFIHETLFVAATLGLLLAGWRAAGNNSVAAAAAGFCAALMLACKETAIIHFVALGVAALVCLCLDKNKIPPPRVWVAAVMVFLAAGFMLLTWFGQDWPALVGLFRAIPNLAARAGGQGHEKWFGYYFSILDPLFIFFIVAAAGAYAVVCDAVAGTRRAGLALAVYALLVFLAYSAIPYKTPWLALNLWLPLALFCGLGVEGVWLQFKSPLGRWGIAIAVAALVLVAGEETKTLAFDHPADERNPLAYAHTTDDILGLPPRIAEISRQRRLAQPTITVVAQDAWPLPWYLRGFPNVTYRQPGQGTQAGAADFIITPTDVPVELSRRLENYRPEYFGVRPDVLIILWTSVTNAL